MMHEYDDLDRALFALPLEEPPTGLRDSIFAITLKAPRLEPASLGWWESIGVGVVLALAVWLVYAIVTNGTIAAQAMSALIVFGRALATPLVLFSLALGFSAVFIVSWLPSRPARIVVRSGRS